MNKEQNLEDKRKALHIAGNQYPVKCPKCQGSGWYFDSTPAPNAFMMPECEECNGKGEIIYEE